MTTQAMSLSEVRKRGLDALKRELGAAGMVRFLQQFEGGSGDYTKERQQQPERTLNEIMEEIRDLQKDRVSD